MAKGLLAKETLLTCTSVVKLAVPEPVTFTKLVSDPLDIEAVPSVIVPPVTVPEPVILPAPVILPPVIVNVPSVRVVDVRLVNPAIVVAVAPKLIAVLPTVTLEFDKDALAILVNVLSGPLIVLFVNVSVVSFNTTVPVAFGNVTVLSAVGSVTVNVVS